jgi:uncharacterized protein (TIGR02118 family)
MYKLIILIEKQDDWGAYDDTWPQFLHHAESMPGLLREVTCRVDTVLYGSSTFAIIHELHFESREALQEAMSSQAGRAAGKVLQSMTGGRMTLLFADHKEDEMENIRRYKEGKESETGAYVE